MKKMKRFVALALSVVMVLAMSVMAFADENAGSGTTPSTGSSNTYTITAPSGTAHHYQIYRIFTGDLHNGVLSNIKWGENGTGSTGTAVDDTTISALTGVNSASDKEKLAVIKTYANLNGTPVATITDGATYTAATAGYYLIKDTDGSLAGKEEAYTLYLVKVVGNIDIQPKSDKPTFEKKIQDTNDSTGATTDWQDSADYDIGDQIPFQLKGTVAANYADYEKYYFAFHDKEERGLTFKSETVKVYVDGTEITSGYEVLTGENKKDSDCTFEVVFSDLKQIASVHAGSVITVEYKSELNTNAKLGEEGNVNSGSLEFSNNPNQEQTGKPETGKTPWDDVIAFTYKVVVNKIDDNKAALAGAEFTLSKKLSDGTTKDIAVVKNTEGTSFTFSGLDDGDYILTETKTPAGYNTISPITFNVSANHKVTWTGETRTTILESLSGNKVTGEITFTSDKEEGSLTTSVENKKGSSLPSTGGIGTTIFYIVGGILMVGAAVLLITKRRAEN